jgi:hypothetical protein
VWRSHAIEPVTLRRDNFEEFFAARTHALMKLIGKAMDKCLTFASLEEISKGSQQKRELHPEMLVNDQVEANGRVREKLT